MDKKIVLLVTGILLLMVFTPLASFTSLGTAKAQGGIRAFILTAEDSGFVSDAVAKLSAFPDFTAIDVYNLQGGSLPSLAQLQTYNSGLVWADFALGSAPGDLISDYVDSGGGVIVMWAADFGGWSLTGRYTSTGKNLLSHSVSGYGSATGIGERVIPSHPILAGVETFENNQYYNVVSTTVNGGIIVAKYLTGDVLVAVSLSGKVAALNFFPPSADVNGGSWQSSTNGALLMRNALLFVAGEAVPLPLPTKAVIVANVYGENWGYGETLVAKGTLTGSTARGIAVMRGLDFKISLTETIYYTSTQVLVKGVVTNSVADPAHIGETWYITFNSDGNVQLTYPGGSAHFFGRVIIRGA
jgi:hypothetical protein